MGRFCRECFCFGYSKTYLETYIYSGLGEKIEDQGDLVREFCPNCNNENLVIVELHEEALSTLKQFDKIVPELGVSLTPCAEDLNNFSLCVEFSIATIILALFGLCTLKKNVFDKLSKDEILELLETAVRKYPEGVVNTVRILSKTPIWEKISEINNIIETLFRKNKDVFVDLL